MVPFRTIALGQQRLKATLGRASDSTVQCGYGIVLHVRKERTRQTLGLITLAGESLPLTARLMQSIADIPLLLAGQTRVTLGLLEAGALAEPDRALDTIVMQVIPDLGAPLFDAADDAEIELSPEVLAGVEAFVSAETLLQPIVLLLPARPVGWPL